MKRKPKHVPEPDAALAVLAAIERQHPGKLASWLRTVERWKPAPLGQGTDLERFIFIRTVTTNRNSST